MEPRGPVVGVGAIALRDGMLLMVRRAKEPARGLWSLPGGHVEPGEYLADAVRRELLEETGLEADVGELAGIFEVVGETHYVILDFMVEVSGDPTPRCAGDVDDARWVTTDDLLDLECTPRFVETLRGWGVLPTPERARRAP